MRTAYLAKTTCFTTTRLTALSFAIALLGGCATVPPGPPPEVVRLQSDLDRMHHDPRIAENAVGELRDADVAVGILATDWRHMDAPVYQHRVYVADRLIGIAEAQGFARFAEVRGHELGAERDRLVAEAKDNELHRAQATANDALAYADAEHQRAEMARADLRELQAQQTQRGLMVTLGDFLFETDRADLKPGATHTLDNLVRALRDDPGATMEISGHTDSVGSREHNLDLSLRRADAVKSYLTSSGIDPARISTQGLGPDFPVASNGTEAGRQQNRRVEVVLQTRVASR